MEKASIKKIFLSFFIIFLLSTPSLYSQEVSLSDNPETEEGIRLIPMGNLEALGTYSDVKDGDNLWGYDISGYFSPIVKFDDTLYLIPLYTVSFKRVREFLPQEEGPRLYSTYLAHNFNLSLRKEFKEDWFIRVTALGTWNYVKETRDEDWGDGLYDYNDVGGSVTLRHKRRTSETVEDFTGGFEYFRREYPNFQSLISMVSPTPPETDEKDFDGFKFSLGYENNTVYGGKFYLKPYFLLKLFSDKHLVREDGTLDLGNKREDDQFNVDWGFRLPLTERIFFSMDNNYTYNYSNIGFYDSKNTLTLADDFYVSHYYSYHSSSLFPSLEYVHPLAEDMNVRVKMGYSVLYRYYTDRNAQDQNGNYKSVNEEDLEHTIYTSLNWPVTKNIDLVTRYSYTLVRSNQKFQQYYQYNYDTYQISMGVAITF